MKYLIASILAVTLTLTLGACARHDTAPTTSTSSSTATTGYSK